MKSQPAAIIWIAVLCLPSLAGGEDRVVRAQEHFDLAEAHFRSESFDLAAAEYAKAYRITRHPVLLFNVALSYEKHGDDAKAVRFYDKYIAAAPKGERIAEAKARRVAIRRRATRPDNPRRKRTTSGKSGKNRQQGDGRLTLRFDLDAGDHHVEIATQGGGEFRCLKVSGSAPCLLRAVPRGPGTIRVSRDGRAPATRRFVFATGEEPVDLSLQYIQSWPWKYRWTSVAIGAAGLGATIASTRVDGELKTVLLTSGILAMTWGATFSAFGFLARPAYLSIEDTTNAQPQ